MKSNGLSEAKVGARAGAEGGAHERSESCAYYNSERVFILTGRLLPGNGACKPR